LSCGSGAALPGSDCRWEDCELELGPCPSLFSTTGAETWGRQEVAGVANMTSYVIYSSLILMIRDNMINETNLVVERVFVDISRSHGFTTS
jgi:hypothetical protein